MDIRQFYYYWKGIFFGFPNAIRRRIFGYDNPRHGSGKNIDQDFMYALEGVERFEVITSKTSGTFSFEGKKVLELGPGPDLYSGIVYLARGASRFLAIDRFPLATLPKKEALAEVSLEIKNRSGNFFEHALSSIENKEIFSYQKVEAEESSMEIKETFDIIVSRAACEHFFDPEQVFRELFTLLAPGGVMIHEIDFQTHNRFVKKEDPLNIYRYSEWVYRSFLAFPGSPNRFLQDDYRNFCEHIGYNEIRLTPFLKCSREYTKEVRLYLASPYQEKPLEDIETLATILTAKKPV